MAGGDPGAFLSGPVKSDSSFLASESAYVHHLVETVLALGILGECVIVGRGAAFILPAATTLRRVRLVGPVRERITALSRKLGITEPEAARQVRTIDRERTDFVEDHFFKDPSDITGTTISSSMHRACPSPKSTNWSSRRSIACKLLG